MAVALTSNASKSLFMIVLLSDRFVEKFGRHNRAKYLHLASHGRYR